MCEGAEIAVRDPYAVCGVHRRKSWVDMFEGSCGLLG